MLLRDLGFPATPQQAVDLLVNRVGHERANATAEVRRSFNGTYSPLYQIAYMMGGLQFRVLRRELVDSGKVINKAFHDADQTIAPQGLHVELAVRGVLARRQIVETWQTTSPVGSVMIVSTRWSTGLSPTGGTVTRAVAVSWPRAFLG